MPSSLCQQARPARGAVLQRGPRAPRARPGCSTHWGEAPHLARTGFQVTFPEAASQPNEPLQRPPTSQSAPCPSRPRASSTEERSQPAQRRRSVLTRPLLLLWLPLWRSHGPLARPSCNCHTKRWGRGGGGGGGGAPLLPRLRASSCENKPFLAPPKIKHNGAPQI